MGDFFDKVKGGLIVSCQALEDEPLYGSDVMAKMAAAAEQGGASGIRANGAEDIRAIKALTSLPVIGLIKRNYLDSEVYITPTKAEIDELISADADIIALDATNRLRPKGETLEELVKYIKAKGQKMMADVSTLEEGVYAEELGFDCISTTLSGYTSYSPQSDSPDFELLKNLLEKVTIPVIAEGRIGTPDQAKEALSMRSFAVVVGSAITRPQLITRQFADKLKETTIIK
ncbi:MULTISPECIES: N-acetylmannosamine-6-phosphate 2-epimerase [Metabacillus]|uniref:N-acetylmannosamine-6-phosphate 2-epimerase n=1 Tax=Metabacillus TaxID=2675233 RepID=UPI00193A132D|nr:MULTISPECIES: N-acetylmannosamine-6-phosphate 2-epimerase [Metabacillus]